MVTRTITLACDRHEYNPTSQLAFRWDWDRVDSIETSATFETFATFEMNVISQGGVKRVVQLDSIKSGQLQQISLCLLKDQNLKSDPVKAGDILQLLFSKIKKVKKEVDTTEIITLDSPLILSVVIVETPVMPSPQAAYALLRQQQINDKTHVECVRYAWSPEASRIELVCPDDLKTQVVRRRAVFKWQDSVRPETDPKYAVQKITQTGSTHFPMPDIS